MPTILGTLGLICLKIIIGIIITIIFSIIIMSIISIFYNKINQHEINDFKFNKLFFRILNISCLLLVIIIIISFISTKGTEYAYRNRIGLLNVTEQSQLYHKPSSIHKFFNPTAKIVINKSQLDKIKHYHLVTKNLQYEKQRRLIIKKAQYRLRYEKGYYTSNY